MNRPSRTDEPQKGDGYNQSPNALSNDLTTNQDLNGISNARELGRAEALSMRDSPPSNHEGENNPPDARDVGKGQMHVGWVTNASATIGSTPGESPPTTVKVADGAHGRDPNSGSGNDPDGGSGRRPIVERLIGHIKTFGKFVGPGFMVAVAYIDPGNYATDVAGGASYQYRLLFIVLLSNIFAIFLQSLSIKLGTVSGLNLAEACRAHLPRWLNIGLYIMAEVAIIATDIAEVIGTAIALNLLIPQLPLVAGCAISIVDVMIILIFYQPNGSMRGLRTFEYFVMCLVLAVVICFCIQLSLIKDTTPGEVFQGYLPSKFLIEQKALYQACGILGATVMPHSLYLGSGIVQPRLRDYDSRSGLLPPEPSSSSSSLNEGVGDKAAYVPSLAAINHSLKYSIAELAISLFTFALFVNSSILIVAGSSLYNNPDALEADIFGIHDLLSTSIAPAAGTVFALALLLSGISAGIVCTISGQMVSEGALNWAMKPWLRRLVTRSISITPSIIIAGAVGRSGLDAALNGSQVALSVVLPFVTAPLIYFTCRNKYMTVQPGMARYRITDGPQAASDEETGRTQHGGLFQRITAGIRRQSENRSGVQEPDGPVKMANSWPVIVFGVVVWVIITAMNVANLVLLGLGSD
ncbi:transporter smf2 [Thozetella sp. PMI_491]|nr:transporter smf2 [Thozetella sp. PMI_491]